MKRPGITFLFESVSTVGASDLLQAAQSCDRQCLVSLRQNYRAALVKHDPKAVPFADEVKFTENTANFLVRDGTWVTASGGPTEFQISAADLVAQRVACLIIMQENGNRGVLFSARPRLKRGKIAEGEHHVVREGPAPMSNFQRPRPGLVEDLAPADRTPRDQMIDIGLAHYDELTRGDGTLAPFAEECERPKCAR